MNTSQVTDGSPPRRPDRTLSDDPLSAQTNRAGRESSRRKDAHNISFPSYNRPSDLNRGYSATERVSATLSSYLGTAGKGCRMESETERWDWEEDGKEEESARGCAFDLSLKTKFSGYVPVVLSLNI